MLQPNQTQSRNCLSCGKPVKGRSDKKFCDDYCRNNYNNQLKGVDSLLIRNINNALKKNRHLLATLLPEGEKTIKTTQDKLLAIGFNFKYFTHQYITQKGNIYHYCYDHGYLHLENNYILIVADKDV
ncbi:hypothetical protein [Niabella ginsengisoli]|uniref:DUF2116 family Zn-ribbon domain-containing protein n=1 Tax=Niabella ginsengisoli TaxID=522298 RepID=A0ABS9SFG3_9BACT|nr:hypothetical protein [Niabella ginsengisoli]MCH5597089.1 hypothetical protein [Niabella ginsengisoli]